MTTTSRDVAVKPEAELWRTLWVLEQCVQAMQGAEVSDFALSFPEVRLAADLRAERDRLLAQGQAQRGRDSGAGQQTDVDIC